MTRMHLDLPRPVAADARPTRTVSPPVIAGSLSLAGFPVRNTRADHLARFLSRRLSSGRKIAVGFVNQNFVTTCAGVRQGPCADESLILVNDGVGMQLAALLRFGRGFRENLNGTDFVPRFLREAGRPLTVFLVGSEPAVVGRAAAVIGRLPHCRVVGHCDGFSLWHREAAVLDEIARVSPDILLVGLGNPVQERWVLQQEFPNWDSLRIMNSRHDHLDWMHRHFATTVVTGSELLAEVDAEDES